MGCGRFWAVGAGPLRLVKVQHRTCSCSRLKRRFGAYLFENAPSFHIQRSALLTFLLKPSSLSNLVLACLKMPIDLRGEP